MATERLTWGQIKMKLSTMSEEQLSKDAKVLIDDADYPEYINSIEEIGEDIWCNIHDDEDSGSLEELKYKHGEDWDETQYKLMTPKNTVFMFSMEGLDLE